MGYTRKRTNQAGKSRYTAVYIDAKGQSRSAGTFSSKKDAEKAWQKKEVEIKQGKVGDPKRGQMTLTKYATEAWLPNHRIEPKTREKYTGYLNKHIIPELGPMKMADIFPEHIREWITGLQDRGVSPWVIQSCKSSILNALFTTALNDQIIYIHPCRGVVGSARCATCSDSAPTDSPKTFPHSPIGSSRESRPSSRSVYGSGAAPS